MQGYGVKIVADDVMPDGVEWMFVKMKDGALVLWLAHSSAGCARTLAEAWAAFRCIEQPGGLIMSPSRPAPALQVS